MPSSIISRAHAPRRLVASALGLVMAGSAAHATDTPAPTPQDKAKERKTENLEGMQVQQTVLNSTSPKFTAPLLDTPRSITIVPQEIIQQTNATSLLDVLRTVPGITFGAGEGGNPNGDRPIIRGFDSESSIFVDGVRSSGSQQREIFDIEQVEVTKGPSSAYTGRGSVGGSINLVTKAPEAKNFIAGSVGLGTDNYRRGTADWNQTFGDDSAFRLNVMGHDADIPGRNGPDQSRWGIAPSVTFGMHADTSVTLSYYHLQTDDTPDSGIPYNNPNNAPTRSGSPIDVPRDTYYGLLDRDFQKQKNDIGQIVVRHNFADGWQVRNTSVYARSTNDYLWTQPDDSNGNFLVNGGIWRRANNRVSATNSLTNQTDLTGSFETGSIRHTIAAGIEIANEKTNRSQYLVDPATSASDTHNIGSITTGACSPKYGIGAASNYWCAPVIDPNPHDPWEGVLIGGQNPNRITTNTRSAWMFDTLDFNEMWQLNLGGRYDHFETKSTAVTTATNATVRVSNNSSFWNWQAGLVFKPAPNGSFYASWGTSSNPPGVDAGDGADGIAATNDSLKPESSRNLELGTKWDLLDQRISLTGAVFRSEKSNARVATGARGSAMINAGKQRVDGVEIGVNGRITDDWNVFAGYTWLDSDLVKPAPADAASKGNQFPNTPKNSFTLWTSYAITPRFTLGGGAFAMDRVYGNTANTKWVPGYTRYDLMASYILNRNVTLQLNVQNLTNKYYFDKAYAAHYANVAPGRVGIVSANFRF
jgi:TonB-dependent siderophore receptor